MEQDQAQQPAEQTRRWRRHFHPLQLTVDGMALSRRPLFLAFALMAAGLLVTLIPVRADSDALGGLTIAGTAMYVPALSFLLGDLCLAAGAWAAIRAARGRPFERAAVAGLGIITAALAGHCLRLALQVIVLRDFYRPALFLTSAARAAAVGWGLVLTVALAAGFLMPLLVAAANLLPRGLRIARRAAGLRWCLMLPFAALAATMIVTQWILPAPLASAMGYSYPAASGGLVTVSLRELGPAAWSSLQILFAVPLLVLMWEGTESARTCLRLARKADGSQTALMTRIQRIDYRLASAAVVIAAGWFAVASHSALAALAGAALLVTVCLSFVGDLGRVARLARDFERGVSRWQLPEDWRDLGRISLLLAVLVLPVLIFLGASIAVGAKAGLWFPSDLSGFFSYWHNDSFPAIPVVTASAIYGHVDVVVGVTSLGLAAAFLLGTLLQALARNKDVQIGYRICWFLFRVGAFAFLLAPVLRLADHSYATLILAGCAVLAILLTFRRAGREAAAWSAILAGGALALWSLALWHTTWLPGAVMLALTVLQRFAYNAGNLNDPGTFRPNRVAYFQSIALISVAMLVLGHGAAAGYFRSDALSAVSDRVSLSVVAVMWMIMLVARQKPDVTALEDNAGDTGREGAGPGSRSFRDEASHGDAGDEPLPRSWAWLLDPDRELISFTGRDHELAVLTAWCQDEHAGRLRLVTGAGGVGKTRLAVELARRLSALGWETAFVGHGQEAMAVDLARMTAGRVLLIADNAETRAGLSEMLTTLADGPDAAVRAVLLARYTGEWLSHAGNSSAAVRNMISQARQAEMPLPAEVTSGKPDSKIVAAAVGSLARKFGLRESRTETRYKKSLDQRPMLELHAAALVATLTDAGLAATGTGTVRADIRSGLDPLLRHEYQFWYDSARQAGLADGRDKPDSKDNAVLLRLRQVIAAGCLLGAASADEASELASRVPGLAPSPRIAGWLLDLWPASQSGTGWVPFMLPACVAELHVLRELTASPGLAETCLTSLTTQQALHAVAFLARASVQYQEGRVLLARILPGICDRITDMRSPARTLTALLSVLPAPDASLRPAVIDLHRRVLEFLPPDAEAAERACWLTSLSARLAEAGQPGEAEAADQEAAAICAQLAGTGEGPYRPDLAAASLANLSIRLTAQGRLDSALTAAAEAAAIYRELATAEPDLYLPSLARALDSLGRRHHALAQHQAASQIAEEAVDLHRELAAVSPREYRPGLADALATLSLRYHELGDDGDALQAGEEAVAIYRELLPDSPRRYRPGLASTLDNCGVYLSRIGRHADALPRTQEAITLYWQQTKNNPGTYRPQRAQALTNLSVRHLKLAQPARGVTPARQAVAIYRELAAVSPGQYQPRLAAGLQHLATLLEASRSSASKADAQAARREAAELSQDQQR